ncbi:F-box protein At4g00755 [Coffea arabica]|uniref:F-box protein At4g00755 n=1 Tax=Coffea arabica TaxID=13443 RepID=A0A6P6WI38_COFAR|nr:F-box protein At4g00755-like [Coffea arabica]
MDACVDFVQSPVTDMVLNIFERLDDPADLVRASVVSHYWRDFVIANGLSKQLCVEFYPQLANVERVTESNSQTITLNHAGASNSMEWDILERNHKVYASLSQVLTKLISSPVECIAEAFSASSTDNYPDESIVNTLDPRDRFALRASYWSSKGHKDPSVPETLIYKLKADFCVITEIDIQPFEAFFQPGDPIYSAKSVRFRMGHPKSPTDIEDDLSYLPLQQPADDKFIWTYTSEEFAMTQENRLQHFKFSQPALCIGGFLQIELLGRVQQQEMDGLLYICVSHVKVMGRPLSPAFHVEILEPSGKFLLKYCPHALQHTLQSEEPELAPMPIIATEDVFWGRVGLLQYLVGGNQEADGPFDLDDEENEMDQFVL